jgi:hypothetical protein
MHRADATLSRNGHFGEEETLMARLTQVMVVASLVVLAGAPAARAFNCPVVIKQAEDLVKKAEARMNADTKPLVDEAKKLVAEARAHHDSAKTKRDHGDAIRKAKNASAYAEEAITLSGP